MKGANSPGGRNRRWVPCKNKVEPGQVRCQECSRALMSHPNSSVREALAKEAGQNLEVLQILADDLTPKVAFSAKQNIEKQVG